MRATPRSIAVSLTPGIHIDLVRDGVTYRMAGLWLDDAELARAMYAVLQPRLAIPHGAGRRRRILGTILLPGD